MAAKKKPKAKTGAPKWTALVKVATRLTGDEMAAKLGVDPSMLRRWCSPRGGGIGAENMQLVRRVFPREAAIADLRIDGADIVASDAAGNLTSFVVKSRLGDALDAEIAQRKATAYAKALELIRRMETIGQPLNGDQLRALAAGVLDDDTPQVASSAARKS